jgi:hypothetical protein
LTALAIVHVEDSMEENFALRLIVFCKVGIRTRNEILKARTVEISLKLQNHQLAMCH